MNPFLLFPQLRRFLVGTALTLLLCTVCCLKAWSAPIQPIQIVFTDEKVALPADAGTSGEVTVALLTPDCWADKPVTRAVAADASGTTQLLPLGEGIHVVKWGKDGEFRFLAIAPPPTLDPAAVRRALPRTGKKLISGEPYTLLAMGDSVTATGDYPRILASLLSRATGNPKVSVEVRAFPGRSVDASVRSWKDYGTQIHPDLGLIMYGLNDQAAGVPLTAYLEQTRWLLDHLRDDCGADGLLLEPTPHIDITVLPSSKGPPPPDASIFRTVTFAEALKSVAEGEQVPVAATFAAIWRDGAPTLQEAARYLWPVYPLSYSKQLTTLLESDGKGDTIHLNALGHLAMAKAVFRTIAGTEPQAPLVFEGSTVWEDGKLASKVKMTNRSKAERTGRIVFYPFPQQDENLPFDYTLQAGETRAFTVPWKGVHQPEDLLNFPFNRLFTGPGPYLQIVDFSGKGSRVYAVRAPRSPDVGWVRERSVAKNGVALAHLKTAKGVKEIRIPLPKGSQVGRIPLSGTTGVKGGGVKDAAELAYVRYGQALDLDPTVDGDLSEWGKADWSPVGEPCQARWGQGVEDHRAKPADCYLHWAFAAGKTGIYLAFRATGEVSKDSCILYFDPRPSAELGTAGPYFWTDATLKPNGVLAVKAGESSPENKGGQGAWRRGDDGVTMGELFVPYGFLGITQWPTNGDLGLSIVWQHKEENGPPTRLMWSENGHPWNTLWFGVVRRTLDTSALPFMIRVR